jgi:DnaJ-class molecular chaperone
MTERENCKRCDGVGTVANPHGIIVTCPECGGRGTFKVEWTNDDEINAVTIYPAKK